MACRRGSALRTLSAVGLGVVFFLLVTPLYGVTPTVAPPFDVVVSQPNLVFQQEFTVESDGDVWRRLLDDLPLVGVLWNAYGFQPAYRITKQDTLIHIRDPSGIEGVLRCVALIPCTYTGTGHLDHWAVPTFFSAQVVIVVALPDGLNVPTGRVKIYLRGVNDLSRLAIRIVKWSLRNAMERRFADNFQKLRKMVDDIVHQPQHVRQRLKPDEQQLFDRLFNKGTK